MAVVSAFKLAEVLLDLSADHARALADLVANLIDKRSGIGSASQRYLADRWRWSRGKVEYFLKVLTKKQVLQIAAGSFSVIAKCKHQERLTVELQATILSHPQGEILSHPQAYFIVGYHLTNCQLCELSSSHPAGDVLSHPFKPNRYIPYAKAFLDNKREGIVKGREKQKQTPPADPETITLANHLNSYLESLKPPAKRKTPKITHKELQRLLKTHKTTHQEVTEAIQWLKTVNPTLEYQFVVRSPRELRYKFQRIRLAMKRPGGRAPPPPRPTCKVCGVTHVTTKHPVCGLCEDKPPRLLF